MVIPEARRTATCAKKVSAGCFITRSAKAGSIDFWAVGTDCCDKASRTADRDHGCIRFCGVLPLPDAAM